MEISNSDMCEKGKVIATESILGEESLNGLNEKV
jgi:hypothetical protein